MKKLIFAVSALAALALLIPNTGFAQHVYSNQLGIYLTADGTGETGTMVIGDPVSLFVVLTKPTDDGEAPYTWVNFFDFQMNFSSIDGLVQTNEVLPPTGQNLGATSIGNGYLEYIVAMGVDYPVTNESVSLVTVGLLTFSDTPIEISLGPASQPSIWGQMSYLSVVPDLTIMYSAGGSHEATVFTFNIEDFPVALEDASFGSVKALYR